MDQQFTRGSPASRPRTKDAIRRRGSTRANRPPAIQVHAEASGHRTIFCCPHTFGSSSGGRITSTATQHDHKVSLEY
jgi:hypothetical protein